MQDLNGVRFPFFLLVFCVFLSGSIFAETQNDTILTRFKLEAAAKLTQAFMVDYQSTKQEKKEELDIDEADGLKKFNILLDDKSIDTLTADDVVAFLVDETNSWSKDGPVVFNNYVNNLKDLDYVDNNLVTVVTYNPKRDKRSDIFSDKMREKILNDLANKWALKYHTNSKNNSPNKAEEANNNQAPSKREIVTNGFLGEYLEIALMGLLIIFFTYSFYASFKIKRLVKKSAGSDHKDQHKAPNYENFKKQLDGEKKLVSDLKIEIIHLTTELEQKNELMQISRNTPDKFTIQKAEGHSEHEWINDEVIPKGIQSEQELEEAGTANIFFISAPESDCKFLTTEIQLEEKSEPYYRFEGKEEGEFQINTSGNIDYEVLFNSPDLYLRNAAEYENNLKSEHVSIKNVSKGKFKVSGDTITVIQKAKIRFV
jgi:hypothetical protein